MSGLTYEQQTKVREAILDYLAKNGMTSLRKVAGFVKKKTGIQPSATTVARHVRELGGYDRKPTPQWEKKQ